VRKNLDTTPADNVRMAVVRAKRKAKRAMEEYTETENH
jgi:hypothetical protein